MPQPLKLVKHVEKVGNMDNNAKEKAKLHRRLKIEQHLRMEKYIQAGTLACQVCGVLEGVSIYQDWGKLYALCPIHKEKVLKNECLVEEYNIQPCILLFDPPLVERKVVLGYMDKNGKIVKA